MMLTLKSEVGFDVDARRLDGEISLPGDERASNSPLVERVWHSHSERGGSFISTAGSNWEIVVTKRAGSTVLTVRGPETRATPADCPPDADFMGITFKAGAFMSQFPARMVLDRHDLNLPRAGSRSFWLDSAAWEYPNFENADTFVARLVRAGLLGHDPLIGVALQEQPSLWSRRTIQRRFLQVTGLTHNRVFQIQRALYATNLLKQGASILDAVERAGYADQPHMNRAFRRFVGQTPGQILSRTVEQPLSFLFKTPPLWCTML